MTVPQHIQAVYSKAHCLYTKQQVEQALDRLAQAIHQQLENSNPILICVLKGGVVLMGNLLPRLDFPLEIDFVHATRYGNATVGGELSWKVKPSANLSQRTVLVLDDILDGGLTLAAITDYCRQAGAAQVYTAVLVDKPEARIAGGLAQADFAGLTVENRFIFGYGLDYQEYLRNAPGIYEVAAEHQ